MPGTPELLVIFLLVLVLFGPDKLPELAKQLAKGMRQLRNASNDLKRQLNLLDDD
jgi:sec-independent protein translocase protein TatA